MRVQDNESIRDVNAARVVWNTRILWGVDDDLTRLIGENRDLTDG